jgi:hypothetical protein
MKKANISKFVIWNNKMKKILTIVILIFAISTLHATEYKFFTAKQGLPKLFEVARQLGGDSLNLYEVYCSAFYVDSTGNVIITENSTVNDTAGTSMQWYYIFTVLHVDSCYKLRVKYDGNNFISDSLITYYSLPSRFDTPIKIDEFKIDSDFLNECTHSCGTIYPYVQLSMMSLCNDNDLFPFFDSYPAWLGKYGNYHIGNDSYFISINAFTGRCIAYLTDVKDNTNQNEQAFDLKSSPNSDLISINSNNELLQNAVLRVYNQVGSLVFETTIESQSYQFSTASLNSGIYFLQLISGKILETKPIIIVH